jgi:outer membrane biosynthesis protein TonB
MASGGTTLVMPRKQFAMAGLVVAALVVGVIVLAVVALRRPASNATPAEGQQTAVTTPASEPAVTAPTLTPTPTPAAPPPMEISEPPIKTAPEPKATTPPSLPATPLPTPRPTNNATNSAPSRPLDTTPLKFEAKAVVAEGDKRRERDTSVVVADGSVTVLQNSDRVLYSIPIPAITGLTYSNSKQPLWNSPNGPAEAMKVDAGAFGFLKGGRNWFGVQTKDSLLVLRVDDDAVARVISGLQDRTGLTLERLIEPKD